MQFQLQNLGHKTRPGLVPKSRTKAGISIHSDLHPLSWNTMVNSGGYLSMQPNPLLVTKSKIWIRSLDKNWIRQKPEQWVNFIKEFHCLLLSLCGWNKALQGAVVEYLGDLCSGLEFQTEIQNWLHPVCISKKNGLFTCQPALLVIFCLKAGPYVLSC